MDNIIFLVFRRMRTPLLVLIVVYSISVLGFVLIPGQDAEGNPWRMDFFHAFYFVSFMATTIGFGEIPYQFTGAQRLWATLSIYTTVVVWFYAIGKLISLVQNAAFQRAITERRFTRYVRHLHDDFYLICGYGDTGSALVRALVQQNQHVVVVEIQQERVDFLRMQNLRQHVPALFGDAGRPLHLVEAGLKHPRCVGVVALTDSNEVNLKIALTSKLLRKDLTVICRSDSHDIGVNMASFGTDHIIDPFDTFATHLATSLQSPALYLLHEWLTGTRFQKLPELIDTPREGLWVICGYGRFGKSIYKRLKEEGIETIVIELEPEKTGKPKDGCVEGRGTEAVTLQKANIERAVAVVAGTNDDTNNLSIIMTAKQLNPKLFVVLRQNQSDNQSIFDAIETDIVMHSSRIIANKTRLLLGNPLMNEFMYLAFLKDESWACELISRITALVNDKVPEVWEVKIGAAQAHAVCSELKLGHRVNLETISCDPRKAGQPLSCIALMLKRERVRILLPDSDTSLRENDRLLFCGHDSARQRMAWGLQNENALYYLVTGEIRAQGWLWHLMFGRNRGKRPKADRSSR